MKLKRIVSTLLMLAMVWVITGCSGSTDSSSSQAGDSNEKENGKKYVVGIALSNSSDKFETYIVDAMKEAEKQHPDFKFIYNDAQNDAAKQMIQLENFITQKVSAIVLKPVDVNAAVEMVDKANAANIPIIILNQTFDGVEKATAYVGSRSIESGLIQMREVAKQLGGKGDIAIINGQMGHEAQIKRTEGNKQIIKEHPGMKVVLEGTAEWDRAKGMALMENWLSSGVRIDAVVANNDEMAIGAIMAIEAAGKTGKILVAGIDATPDALEYVKKGELQVTVFQDAFKQGKAAIETAVKAAKGEKVDDVIVPYELVTKENVDEYIKKWEQ